MKSDAHTIFTLSLLSLLRLLFLLQVIVTTLILQYYTIAGSSLVAALYDSIHR